jgi:hypothetical protein
VLDGTDFPRTLDPHRHPLLSSKTWPQEQKVTPAWQRLPEGEVSERPQLLSLMQANVALIPRNPVLDRQ